MEPDSDSDSHRALQGTINAQPNSLSFLKWIQIGVRTAAKICALSLSLSLQVFYLYTVHMCTPHTIRPKPPSPVCVCVCV